MEADEQQSNFHDDFTTASQWEIFIARIEEAIYDWKLPQLKPESYRGRKNGFQVEGVLQCLETNLTFSDVEFTLRYFYRSPPEGGEESQRCGSEEKEEQSWAQQLIESDILDEDGERGSSGIHPVELWYGLSRFVLLSPTQNYSAITSESRAKLLLSSAKIAINNSKCPVPIFVQVHQPHQNYFMGIWQGPGMQTDFTMVHLRQAPRHCKYLTGLLDIFKSKLASVSHSPAQAMASPIEVSARIHFVLKDWPMNNWMQSPPDFELLHGQVGIEHIGKLPFGADSDPIRELHLLAEWRRLPEGVLVDRDGYSDLAPGLASRWSLQAHLGPPTVGLLSKSLGRLINLCSSSTTLRQLLGDIIVSSSPESSASFADSLNSLTEPKVPSWSKLVPSSLRSSSAAAKPSRNTVGPIPEQMLMVILYYLFPDADESSGTNPYPKSLEREELKTSNFREKGSTQFKSCPVDSLIWRLAIVTALVADASQGGLRAGAHLWYEVTQEMRYRWDHAITIPGLVAGCPDLRSCLLYQKLQMLNHCIYRRQEREKRARAQGDQHSDNEFEDMPEHGSSEEDDEFYECDDEVEVHRRKEKHHSLWDKPEGRLSKHGNLQLLESNEPLFIPITQEPPPKTEDQRHEDAEVLMMLGDDAQGSELRAQIMSPLLLSDMEAFKAANPGSCLGDFVRWYSPRDWIEEENKLSPRMLIKGNTWQELWTAAKPVPAARQKRLFDDTKEAEKVLFFIESRKPADAFQLLLPALIHAVVARLGEEWLEVLSPLTSLTALQERASRLSINLNPNLNEYSRFVDMMSKEEAKVAQLKSLREKFEDESFSGKQDELTKFLCDLLKLTEVEVPEGSTGVFGQKISSMFLQAQKAAHLIPDEETSSKMSQSLAFPAPSAREFLLRGKASVPSPISTASPQRLFAVVNDNSFRLAGAFTHDTVFY